MDEKIQIPSAPKGFEFWDALAPHHATIEDHYLDVSAIRQLMHDLLEPVLVVGAGQGLIVAEIRKARLECDGIDLSSEMIRYAKLRRGIDIIHADASAMPFPDHSYGTVIFATGVIDFIEDEIAIRKMLEEGCRVVRDSGKVFVAFYQINAESERFMNRIGLLKDNTLIVRPAMEMYLLSPFQMISWIANKAGVNHLSAAFLFLRMFVLTPLADKRMAVRMQKILRKLPDPKSLINTAPETQPYRNQAAIRNLFQRQSIKLKQLDEFASCCIARIY